ERYFQDKSWYSPVTGKIVQEEALNRYEKANIDFLVDLENQYKNYII
ncbi:MAG TPA: YARHG domain-containing protein, partial [Candidatus Blautia merdipullorum]|nr:YARHG domain-containing protein [Candidatus Blautia merdipullorum]